MLFFIRKIFVYLQKKISFMLKIMIVSCVWNRPQIFAKHIKSIEILTEKLKDRFEIEVFYMLSHEDVSVKENIKIIENSNIKCSYGFYKNMPISDKHNAAFNTVLKYKTFDYVMNCGDDDLIHHSLFDVYESYFGKKDVFGIDLCYFSHGDKTYAFRYEQDFVIGCGRMISRKALEKTVAKCGNLYSLNKNSGLDMDSCLNMAYAGFKQHKIVVVDFPYIVDVKSDANITPLFKILKSNNTKEVKKNILKKTFDYL